MKKYGIAIVLAATLLVSCSRDEGATPGGGRRELAVNVQMASSDWTTRSGADGTFGGASATEGTHDRTQVRGSAALGEQLEIVTEYGTQDTPGAPETQGAQGTPEAQDAPDAPLTRGTPIISSSQLGSLGFAVYTNSVFTKNCTATNTGGSWNIAGNMTVAVDKDTYSYYAYAPVAEADNGIKLNEADGKSLTYTAPADITKQPDLCWATPITDDKNGSATFAMQHALTAVGIKVRAANVTIKSITLKQVNTAGTLNLTSGTWGSVTTPKDLTFTLNNTTPITGDREDNITPTDGYLMLPPQALSGDDKTLVIVYQYKDEAERTGTHKLSDITGGPWTAGQRVNYVIQLKSNFSLSLTPASATVPLTAGSYTFSYTTGSLASIDPNPTCDVDWVTGLGVNHSTGKISFNYAQNYSIATARQATIKVTSGFTTQNFTFKQLGTDPWIKLSSKAPSGEMDIDGGSYTTTVTTPVGVAWKVASASPSNCSVSPTSGSGGETVKITVPTTTEDRDVSVTFSTNVGSGITEKTDTWSGKQLNLAYINGVWWAMSNTGGGCDWNTAMTRCVSPWRLPTLSDADALIDAPAKKRETVLGTDQYWSSTELSSERAHFFYSFSRSRNFKTRSYNVRCIR